MSNNNNKKNRLWHSTGEFLPFYLCRSCGSSRSCGLSGQCLQLCRHTQPASCVRLPLLVKRSSDRQQQQQLETKLFGFTSLPLIRHYNLLFLLCRCCSCGLRKWHITPGPIRTRSGSLAQLLHVNLFGRNDKNQECEDGGVQRRACLPGQTDPACRALTSVAAY